jgi:uncharacterized protein (DUF2336 family)
VGESDRGRGGGAAATGGRASGAPDLAGLFELARRKSKEGRSELFATVRDLFLETGDALSERERSLMGDILRRLVRDVETAVRRDLAARLARHPHAPHDLVRQLADDTIEVAYPLLAESEVLAEEDLIEIVRQRSQSHQLAVASRRAIGPELSDALVATGNEDVIVALLNNHGARISAATMEYLVEQSRTADAFQEPLVRRADLPPGLARSMYLWVSAALRQHLVKSGAVDPDLIDDTIEAQALDLFGPRPRDRDPGAAERVVQGMKMSGVLNERTLLQFLRQGEAPLFEAALGALVGIEGKLVRRLLFERGAEALAVACKSAGFQESTYKAIYLLSRRASNRGEGAGPEEVRAALALYRQIKPSYAKAVVRRWRRDPQYQYALNKIEIAG